MIMYSIDIAKERLDEQDKRIISHVLSQEWKVKRCLILGSGEGRIGVVLALLGFEVVSIDIDEYQDFYSQTNQLFSLDKKMNYIKEDLQNFNKELVDGEFSLVLAQRVLHYLPYEKAQGLLATLPKVMSKKSYLYLAVSCIDSAMGIEYKGDSVFVEKRFHKLSAEMQKRFSLTVPVCLYSLREFKQLMKETHFKKMHVYQTSFGNIKGLYRL